MKNYKILADRLLWNKASAKRQDSVVESVAGRLGPAFALKEIRVYSCNNISHRIASFVHAKTGIIFNLIPGGTFIRGTEDLNQELEYIRQFSRLYEMDFFELEYYKEVTIAPFLIGRYPVTFAQWGKGFRKLKKQEWKGRTFPIEKTGWHRVQEWLNKIGDNLRLSSDNEWEYACRAGSTTRYFWGDSIDDRYCWYRSNSENETRKVTLHDRFCNAFGLVDMLGNVSEWCRDEYQDWEAAYAIDYYITRGGCHTRNEAFCRSAHVGIAVPTDNATPIGFRAAISL